MIRLLCSQECTFAVLVSTSYTAAASMQHTGQAKVDYVLQFHIYCILEALLTTMMDVMTMIYGIIHVVLYSLQVTTERCVACSVAIVA